MERIEKTIEVDCPIRTVYNQWTQFEDFPQFMAGVKEVRQLDDTHLHWRAEIWGKDKEWDAEITEQTPDERISWRSVGGATNAGTVRFEPLAGDRTRVRLVMSYEPEGRGRAHRRCDRCDEQPGAEQRRGLQDIHRKPGTRNRGLA